jgi:hypothetical protein
LQQLPLPIERLLPGTETSTDGDSRIRIDRTFIVLDVLDFAFLVDYKRRPPGPLVAISAHRIFSKNSVLGQDRPVHIAEQRKGDSDLLGESRVRWGTIRADSKHNRAA